MRPNQVCQRAEVLNLVRPDLHAEGPKPATTSEADRLGGPPGSEAAWMSASLVVALKQEVSPELRTETEAGSLLSGKTQSGDFVPTLGDKFTALAGILAGNALDYDSRDPNARRNGGGGGFGWLDFGDLNMSLWMIAAHRN